MRAAAPAAAKEKPTTNEPKTHPPPTNHNQKPTTTNHRNNKTNKTTTAIECFASAGAVVVPRSRFAPVKTCADLFVLRSDAYALSPSFTIEPTVSPAPLVKLDDAFYKLVDRFDRLVPRVPSLVRCKSLSVKGAVRFGPGVVLEGEVALEAFEGATALEPATVSQATLGTGKHVLPKKGGEEAGSEEGAAAAGAGGLALGAA